MMSELNSTPGDSGLEVEEGYQKIPPDLPPEPPTPRWRGFFRSCLLWSIGLLGLFALGIAATWVLQVRPRMDEISVITVERDALQDQVSELEEQADQLATLSVEHEQLEEQFAIAAGHRALLGILLDVTTARLALERSDTPAAVVVLGRTQERVNELEEAMDPEHRDSLESIQKRLELVWNELEDDPETAARDLDILVTALISLERSLYGR
jgi:hypothetical protein